MLPLLLLSLLRVLVSGGLHVLVILLPLLLLDMLGFVGVFVLVLARLLVPFPRVEAAQGAALVAVVRHGAKR